MKRTLLILSLAALASFNSCKEKAKDNNSNTTTSGETSKEQPKAPVNAPLTYTITYSPDSAILGISKEAFVKFTGGEAVALQDPDGKATGMSVTINVRITNKSTLDNKKYFSVQASDARLELDNGTSVPLLNSNGNSSPEPEASAEASWKVETPAGTKPTKLNLFLNGTRVAVGLVLAEKK